MDKNLKKAVSEDNLKRSPGRYIRLLPDDDKAVMERGGAPSTR
jgi:hypothetical protein